MSRALIQEVMRRDVPAVDGYAPIRSVTRAMAAMGLTEVVVCVKSEPRGIVTAHDILREVVVHGQDAATPISWIAGAPVCVLEDTAVDHAAELLRHAGVRAALVIDALHRLHGMVTLSDLASTPRPETPRIDHAALMA